MLINHYNIFKDIKLFISHISLWERNRYSKYVQSETALPQQKFLKCKKLQYMNLKMEYEALEW